MKASSQQKEHQPWRLRSEGHRSVLYTFQLSCLDFPGVLKYELPFDQVWVRFHESKGEAVTHHRSSDRLKITRGDPVPSQLLDALRGGGWRGGGGLWPGEKDSHCEGDFSGSCRKSWSPLEQTADGDLWTWRVRGGL